MVGMTIIKKTSKNADKDTQGKRTSTELIGKTKV